MNNGDVFLFVLAMQFLVALCFFILVSYFAYVLWTMRRELPYVPTPYSIIRRMIALAVIQAHDRVVDLGSGSGRIVLEVARQYPVTVVGVELSPLLLAASRLRQLFTRRRGKVLWEKKDLFTYPLDGVTVVFCFLITNVLTRLAPRLEQLPKGARIVSYKFAIPLSSEWKKEEILFGKNDRIYCYRKTHAAAS